VSAAPAAVVQLEAVSKLERRPKDLILIVAREFASRLATAVLVTDDLGNLVYYNEPAERLLGRTFAETGEIDADDWATLFAREELDGTPLASENMPSRIALRERRPAHGEFFMTALDGVRRELSATAFPLLSSDGLIVGCVSIFWQDDDRQPA
jgi:PAS domain-containing protein